MRLAVNEPLQIRLDLLQQGSDLQPVQGHRFSVSLNLLQKSNHNLNNQACGKHCWIILLFFEASAKCKKNLPSFHVALMKKDFHKLPQTP